MWYLVVPVKATDSQLPSFSRTPRSAPNQAFLRHLKAFPHTCLKPTKAHTSSRAEHLSSLQYHCVIFLIALFVEPPYSSSVLEGIPDSSYNDKNKNFSRKFSFFTLVSKV